MYGDSDVARSGSDLAPSLHRPTEMIFDTIPRSYRAKSSNHKVAPHNVELSQI